MSSTTIFFSFKNIWRERWRCHSVLFWNSSSGSHEAMLTPRLLQQSGNKDWVNQNIAAVCAQLGGNYNPNTGLESCWNTGLGLHYNFYIYNLYDDVHYMDPNGCVTYMQKENNGCQYGGDSTYS